MIAVSTRPSTVLKARTRVASPKRTRRPRPVPVSTGTAVLRTGCVRRCWTLRVLTSSRLLQLDAGARLLEFAFELVGLVAFDALLDRLGGLVDERLGLFQAEAGRGAHDLDDLDLLVARAGKDHVDGARFFFGARRVAAAPRRGGGPRPRSPSRP